MKTIKTANPIKATGDFNQDGDPIYRDCTNAYYVIQTNPNTGIRTIFTADEYGTIHGDGDSEI
jgi:hypothetical protein